MLKKHELDIPEFLAEATTEMSETTEMPEPDNPIQPDPEEPIQPEPEKPICPDSCERDCGENEEFVKCYPERMDLYCRIPTFVGFKPDGCFPHCACKRGYARDHANRCVPEEECLKVQGRQKVWAPHLALLLSHVQCNFISVSHMIDTLSNALSSELQFIRFYGGVRQ
ncbi:hypothetical protein Y032_0006g3063 [Ancylostoma ceylanicum]|nr:hypothetical protein Y032_0006g3063 [Ancylostoma ceylanicum]